MWTKWKAQPLWFRVLIMVLAAFVVWVLFTTPLLTETASAHELGPSHRSQHHPHGHKGKGAHLLRVSPEYAARGVQCKQAYTYFNTKTGIGLFLFKHQSWARWCFNGRKVSDVSFRTSEAIANWVHWHVTKRFRPVSGGGTHYRYKRFRFEWEACWLWYCQHRFTYNSFTVRDDGSWTADAGWG